MIDERAVRRDAVWPVSAVTHVRKLYQAWNWAGMHSGSLDVVKSVEHVWVEPLGSNARFVLVLRDPREGAVVHLQPVRPMHGVLMDAVTGETLGVLQYDPGNAAAIELPRDSKVLLLAMQER